MIYSYANTTMIYKVTQDNKYKKLCSLIMVFIRQIEILSKVTI